MSKTICVSNLQLYVLLHIFFMLCSNILLWTLYRCVGPFVTTYMPLQNLPLQKNRLLEACGGTQRPAASDVACSVVSASRHWCFSDGQVPNNTPSRGFCEFCFSKLAEFTTLLRACVEGVWSAMDWQPAQDSLLSVAGIDMGKQRITDSLSLHVSGEEMPCIIPDIPPNTTSLYKQGTALFLGRPTVISKLNTSVPMGSCTGLVIQQILISSNILWGAAASAALDIVVKFPDTHYMGFTLFFFILPLFQTPSLQSD